MKNRILLFFKGMAMGAADVVPGVSGGTIAFITGIYEELINSLNQINIANFKLLFKEGLPSFWRAVNGPFFLFLLTGILVSILSFAQVILYVLEHYPVQIWSFFFGLIIASAWLIGKTVKSWNLQALVALVVGAVIAYFISSAANAQPSTSTWFIFICGAIAICAMILPGISGSFVLVLLGAYQTVLGALKDKNLLIITVFGSGCVVGLLSFSKLLKFLFDRFKDFTIALLAGFMIGSLYKVWPWKQNVGNAPLVVHSDGREEWLTRNVWPQEFVGDNLLWTAIALMAFGLLVVVVLDRFGPRESE